MNKFDNIKLFVTDLDGTLLNFQGQVSSKNKEAIKKLKEKNIKIVVNTGRPIYSIPKDVLDLPLDYIVCNNGQYIKNMPTNQVIEKESLSRDELIYLHKLASKSFSMSNIHYDKITYLALEKKYILFGLAFDYLNRLRFVFKQRKHTKVKYVTNINEIELEPNAKICFISTHSNLKKIKKRIESLNNKPYHGFFVAKNWLEVMHSDTSKASAVMDICKLENISLKDTIAFGDGENDRPMLECVGLGVAMKNGMEATKKVAKYITDTNINDGLATFLENKVI